MLTVALFTSILSLASAPPRPIVLVVPGRGHAPGDSAVVRRDALRALQAGALAAVGDTVLGEADVRVAWYADLLDVRGGVASCAGAAGAGQRSPLGAFALVAGAFLDAVASVADSGDGARADTSGARTLRGLAGDLRYFGDPAARCAAERRVGDALGEARLEGRQVVLVAHSLGALVAYGHLQRGDTRAVRKDAPERVYRLVTLGSPLGAGDVRRLVLGDDAGPLALPSTVRAWVNVRDSSDTFSSPVGSSGAPARGVSEVTTETVRDDPHRLDGYLRDPASARAILGAWCEAAERTDAACARLRGDG